MSAADLVVEDVSQLLVVHPLARIGYGHFYIVVGLLGADADVAALVGELAGVVGERAEHEEREHAVGLHTCCGGLHAERDASHLEAGFSFGHDVEEGLQREALYAQAELSLTQLNPVGEHVVALVDFVGQLANIFYALVARLRGFAQPFGFVDDAVDERRDIVDERHL